MIRIKTDIDLFDESYCAKGFYLCTCDDYEEKESVKLGDTTIFLNMKINNNHRVAHPQIGTIHSTAGDTCFEAGDKVICVHMAFTNEDKSPKVYIQDGETIYSKIANLDIIAKIDGDKLIPRDGILLCETIKDNLLRTTLQLAGDLHGKRRDLLKVTQMGNGVGEDIKIGDLILVEEGADYLFEYKGKEYARVDYYFDDVLGVVDSQDWRVDDLRKHATNHKQEVGDKYG
jgi:co-chaperonin GroES (HSP10)